MGIRDTLFTLITLVIIVYDRVIIVTGFADDDDPISGVPRCTRYRYRSGHTSAKWAVHILHIGNDVCIFCISCILFCIFCILHAILSNIMKTCILFAYFAFFCIFFCIFCILILIAYCAYFTY